MAAQQLALDIAVTTVAAPQRETPSESLRRRQAEAIAAGYHPLSVALQQPIRLHPNIPPRPLRRAR